MLFCVKNITVNRTENWFVLSRMNARRGERNEKRRRRRKEWCECECVRQRVYTYIKDFLWIPSCDRWNLHFLFTLNAIQLFPVTIFAFKCFSFYFGILFIFGVLVMACFFPGFLFSNGEMWSGSILWCVRYSIFFYYFIWNVLRVTI